MTGDKLFQAVQTLSSPDWAVNRDRSPGEAAGIEAAHKASHQEISRV